MNARQIAAQNYPADWQASEHRSNLFDVCHDPEEAYKRISALEEIDRVLARRIDDLEAENARLKQHVRDLTAEAA